MCSNRFFDFLAILTFAVLAQTANGYAGSGGGGGGGMGGGGVGGGSRVGIAGGVGTTHGFDISSGGTSGMGFGHVGGINDSTHSYSSGIATPATTHLGNPGMNLGTLPGMSELYSTGIGHTGSWSIGHDDMTLPGNGIGLSYSGGIRPVDPGLDMTKIGRLGNGTSTGKDRYDNGPRSTLDSLDPDVKKFDAELGLKAPTEAKGASGDQMQNQSSRPGMQKADAKRQLTAKQQAELEAEQQAVSREELNQTLATIGVATPGSNTVLSLSPPISSPTPPVTVVPDPSLSTSLPPSATTDPSIQGQVEDSSAPLSADDLSSLRSVFFPTGRPSPAATTPQSTTGVALGVGSTLPFDIALYPLPGTALPSAVAESLGYFFNGQSIVIADFNSRSIVGVVNNGS